MVWFKLTGECREVKLMTNIRSIQEIREKGMHGLYGSYSQFVIAITPVIFCFKVCDIFIIVSLQEYKS